MSKPRATLLSWSSGKDSAYALSELRKDVELEVVGLLTTVNQAFERVAMHAVRAELLERQAKALDLPLWRVDLPYPCSNEAYEACMSQMMEKARRAGIEHIAFGDLFLEDIRSYREKNLQGTGITPLFPLWQCPTSALARDMLAAGIVAHLTTVDPKQLAPEFVGRRWDEQLLLELPPSVDPCGENGEFHTFVSSGPGFRQPIAIEIGQFIERDGFWYADIRAL